MNIKSFIVVFGAVILSASVFAQSYEVTAARTEYDKYVKLKGSPKLADPSMKLAKESIDKAVLHKKTSLDPGAWALKAVIYSELAAQDTTSKGEALLAESSASIKKAKELDVKAENKVNIETAERNLYSYQMAKGKRLYDQKNYQGAYTEFSNSLNYSPNDTTANYASGLSAMYAKDYPKAIARYNELLKTNYSALESVYSNLSIMYAQQKDTASAIRVLSEGTTKFPLSTDLATREIEFSLMSGKQKQIISKIETQVSKNPTNKLYPFYLGIAYDSAKDFVKAEEAYKKAIAIDPAYSDAYINLGGLIMNSGIETYNKANKQFSSTKLTPTQLGQYNAMKNKAVKEFDRAFPFLEKAVQLNPNSELALRNLKSYYAAKSNEAKAAEIDAKIKALK